MITQWEYTSLGSTNFEAEEIKELGRKGWELVSVFIVDMQQSPVSPIIKMPVFMFKRPITNLKLES